MRFTAKQKQKPAIRPSKAQAERFIMKVERGKVDLAGADFAQINRIISDASNALRAMHKGHRSRAKVGRVYNAAIVAMHRAIDEGGSAGAALLGNRVYPRKRGRR